MEELIYHISDAMPWMERFVFGDVPIRNRDPYSVIIGEEIMVLYNSQFYNARCLWDDDMTYKVEIFSQTNGVLKYEHLATFDNLIDFGPIIDTDGDEIGADLLRNNKVDLELHWNFPIYVFEEDGFLQRDKWWRVPNAFRPILDSRIKCFQLN